MAQQDDKVTTYRTPHEGPSTSVPADAPREALGRLDVPVLGPVDLDLALGRPIRLDLDAELLDVEPGSAVIARLPDLPTVELRRFRVDLTSGTVSADADALGPFLLRAASAGVRVALRKALDWQPGRSALDLAAQNLPLDPLSGARRVWAGPAGTSVWLHPDSRLSAELRGDRAEVALTHAALIRVLGVGLPILAVRLLFGAARLEIDAGPTGPVRRAMLKFAAWVATRWLRRRMPEAMKIPGYDLFADEQRRTRLVELARRVQGRKKPKRQPTPEAAQVVDPQTQETGANTQVPEDTAAATGTNVQVADAGAAAAAAAKTVADPAAAPAVSAREGDTEAASAPAGAAGEAPAGSTGFVAELKTLRLTADKPPQGARVLAKIPLGDRGVAALATDAGQDVVITRAPGGLRLDAPGGLYLVADDLPDLSELRLVRVQLFVDENGGPSVELQTDPPLGPLLRALSRKLGAAYVAPKLSPELLARLGLTPETGPTDQLIFRQQFNAKSGLELRTELGAEVRVRHTEAALVVDAPAGLRLAFWGLPFLPDATIRRLEYRWDDGGLTADTTPDLGEFGQLALAQMVRVRAAPVLPTAAGVKKDGGPQLDPQLKDQFSALLVHTDIPVLGALDVRIAADDDLAVRVDPTQFNVTSARAIALVAGDLELALKLTRADYLLPADELRTESDPPLGDYLSELVGRCVEHFALPQVRPHVPLWPAVQPGEPWLLAQVPKDSKDGGLGVRVVLPPGAGIVAARGADAIEVRAEAPIDVAPEGSPLIGAFTLSAVRYAPRQAKIELTTEPPAGPLLHEVLRRVFARFVPYGKLEPILKRAALPAPAPQPPPAPAPAGAAIYEQIVPKLGVVRVALDQARTVDLSLQRRGVELSLGQGASARAQGLGLQLVMQALRLNFMPWTVELDTNPDAGELELHMLSHALRALFTQYMGYFWPTDRSPKAGYDTLLAVGGDQGWGPVKVCVARGGSVDLHVDRDVVSLRSAAGLFVTGESIDWLPDFYVHELSVRLSTSAVTLKISGIEEQVYHETAPVSPVTEAVLSHLLRVLALPKLPPVWAHRLGVPRFPLPPPPAHDGSRVVVFGAKLPGEYGDLMVSMDAGDRITVRANENEASVESDKGLVATMPALRLAIQLRGARYHLQTGEVQVGGLGQLENALIEAVLRRQIAQANDGQPAPDVRGVLDKLDKDSSGRVILYKHAAATVLLQPGTSIRLRLDDRGLRVDAEPGIYIDGLARANFKLEGLRYSFDTARFSLDLEGDTKFADLLEGFLDRKAEQALNEKLLPMLPEAMRTPGYHLTTDPRARDNIAQLIQSFARGKADAKS